MNLLNKTVRVVLPIVFAISMFLPFAAGFAYETLAINTNVLQLKLEPDDPDALNRLGSSVAVDGDILAAGAPMDNIKGVYSGAVYIFTRTPDGWTQQAKLTGWDTRVEDRFGSSVAIKGDTLVVGAPLHSANGSPISGAAYVFVNNSGIWEPQGKLTADQITNENHNYEAFGTAAALSRDAGTIVIGAVYNDERIPGTGKAYVFKYNGISWEGHSRLAPENAIVYAATGSSAAIDGNTIALGAPNDANVSGVISGAVYVFEYDDNTLSWVEKEKLTPVAAIEGEGFGAAVAITGDTAVIGTAPKNSGGSAYVFAKEGAGWMQKDRFISDNGVAGDAFGISAAVNEDADNILIGEIKAYGAGVTHLFTRQNKGWRKKATLQPPESQIMDQASRAVALDSSGTIVIGAPGTDNRKGAVYVMNTDSARGFVRAFSSMDTLDAFGAAIAAGEDGTVIVGLPRGGESPPAPDGMDYGAAYVLKRNGMNWELQAELFSDPQRGGDAFGLSVAIDGDIAAVGEPLSDQRGELHQAGRVFLFERDGATWTQRKKLLGISENDGFGASIAISGGTLAVSAPGRRHGSFSYGSVYLYERSDGIWQEPPIEFFFNNQIALNEILPDSVSEFFLGGNLPVAANGNTILVGAPLEIRDFSGNTGVIHVYERNGDIWEEGPPILAGEPAYSAFGASVSIDGNIAVIGQLGNLFTGMSIPGIPPVAGSVYVFEYDGAAWIKKDMLMLDDGTLFGFSIAASNDSILVGDPFHSLWEAYLGAAYLYTRKGDTWRLQEKLNPGNTGAGSFFGAAVAINGDARFIGMPGYSNDLLLMEPITGAMDIFPAMTQPSEPAGSYANDLSIKLNCIECTNIYYTVDGSMPTTGSPVYTDPISISSTTVLKYFAEGGPAGPESVTELTYVIDRIPPVASITFPGNDAITGEFPSITGTASDTDNSGGSVQPAYIELAIQDIAAGKYVDLDETGKFGGFTDTLVWIKALGTDNWQLNTDTVVFVSEQDYLVSARAVDLAGNVSEQIPARFTYFPEDPVFTSLSLNTNSSTILNDGILNVVGRLRRYPYDGEDLSGLDIVLEITDPHGEKRIEQTTTSMNSGEYQFTDLSGFDQKGSYTFQSAFAGTPFLLPSEQAKPRSVLVGQSAGYAVLVQGKISNNEGLEAHDKTLTRIYNLLLNDRGFEKDNIRYLNYEPARAEVYAKPAKTTVRDSIASWACERISNSPAPFYLIMVDHGNPEIFFIDNDTIIPDELHSWLGELENCLADSDAKTGLDALLEPRIIVNGACYSGSFIPALSAPGRTIVTSATAWEVSYKGLKEKDGIRSGEFFIDELFLHWGRGRSLRTAFEKAVFETEFFTRSGHPYANKANPFLDDAVQHPLLDDNGDGTGSNVLVIEGDGQEAESLFLGAGLDYVANPGGPADIKRITPTLHLSEDDTAGMLFLEAINPLRVDPAIVEIRTPSKILTAHYGLEHNEQIDIDLDSQFLFKTGTDRYELMYAGFQESGKYDIFYKVSDTETGNLSPIRHSVVYKNRKNNSPPDSFSLILPAPEAKTRTVLVFDWENSSDPDGDPLTYTFLIAEDPRFREADIVHKEEGLSSSLAYADDNTGLEDLKRYYWKVIAVDFFGAKTESDIYDFTTDNPSTGMNGCVDGAVDDSAVHAYINDFNVALSPEPPNLPVIATGENKFATCPDTGGGSEFILEVSAPGYEPAQASVTALPGQTASEIFFLTPSEPILNPGKLQLLPSLFHPDFTINEDGGAITFGVQRIDGFDGSVSVDYTISDGTAVADQDYSREAGLQGRLMWNEKTGYPQSITVQIIDDGRYETDTLEKFMVKLSNPLGDAVLGAPSEVEIAIIDNDPKPPPPPPDYGELQFSPVEYSVSEGNGTVTLKVERVNGDDGHVSAEYVITTESTAGPNGDYIDWNANNTLGFLPRKTLAEFSFDIENDNCVEGDETIVVLLSNPKFAGLVKNAKQAVVTIEDDDTDTVQFPNGAAKAVEDSGVIAVNVSRDPGYCNARVDYQTNDDTARAGVDYTAINETLFFAAGETQKTIHVPIKDNDLIEEDKKFSLTLSNPAGANLGTRFSMEVTIEDDDSPPAGTLQFSESTYFVDEGDGHAAIAISREDGNYGEICVDFATITANQAELAALPAVDYTHTEKKLCWGDSKTQSQSVDVPILDDEVPEEDEIILLWLSDPTNRASLDSPNPAFLTIKDNDKLPSAGTLRFSENAYQVKEGVPHVTIAIRRKNGDHGKVCADFATVADGLSEMMYTHTQENLCWEDGETQEKKVDIPIMDDEIAQGDQIVLLGLSNPAGHVELGISAFLVILDDEIPPGPGVVQFPITAPYVVYEKDKRLEVTVLRTDGSEGEVSVAYAAVRRDGTAERNKDYLYQANTLTWADGELGDKRFTINIEDDEIKEPDENLFLMLSDPSNDATLKSPSMAEVIIKEALPDLGGGIIFDKEAGLAAAADAVFKGGISVDDKEFQQVVEVGVTEETMIQVKGVINVESAHVGKKADLLVAAGYRLLPAPDAVSVSEQNEKFLLLDKNKTAHELGLNQDVDTLAAFRENVVLEKEHIIDIFGPVPVFVDIKFRVFFGYRLENGTVVFNGIRSINGTLHVVLE
ncbi:MAG: hypothetical protein GY862_13215, partial [Gammaproteobacteria bacterium]|nr:hypothetical protein [Gammaproteobacteria bacterium]